MMSTTLLTTQYSFYADFVSHFSTQDTIYNTDMNNMIIKTTIPTDKNIILYYQNPILEPPPTNVTDTISLEFLRSGNNTVGLASLGVNNLLAPQPQDVTLGKIKEIEQILRNTIPDDLVVIFCSDNLSDQIQIPGQGIVVDREKNTISLDYNVDTLTSGINTRMKNLLAPGGPKLLIIFKKSDSNINPLQQQMVIVKKRRNILSITPQKQEPSSLTGLQICAIIVAILCIFAYAICGCYCCYW